MKTLFFSITLLFSVVFISCSTQKKTYIVVNDNEVVIEVGKDLASYLSKTYPKESFIISNKKGEGTKNIIIEITSSGGLRNDEAYKIFSDGDLLFIQGETSRALVNGVYGLLKELGWNFYLSFEVPPVESKPLNFSAKKIENAPLKEKRIIFNWHNFLSGCTGWNLEQWQKWIDNASKIGFNTIMVHAYGNNPM